MEAHGKFRVCFRFWTRVGAWRFVEAPDIQTCDDYVDVFVVNTYDSCTRNIGRIPEIDVAITSNSYGKFRAAESFEELGERGAVGVSVLQNDDAIKQLLLKYDWESVARQSAAGSRYINKDIVKGVIMAAGFYDARSITTQHKLF